MSYVQRHEPITVAAANPGDQLTRREQPVSKPHDLDVAPGEILEAARVDGAQPGQVLWHIMVPLIRPGLGAAAVLAFIFSASCSSGTRLRTRWAGTTGINQAGTWMPRRHEGKFIGLGDLFTGSCGPR